MKVTVWREACCSQDDQAGPLEAEYNIEADAALSSLIRDILASNFLQFSSTHHRMTGEVDGQALVEVFLGNGAQARAPEFKVNADKNVGALLPSGKVLHFSFRHVSP